MQHDMGGGTQELTGPDFEQGVAFSELAENQPRLGHAHGEAVVVVRVGDGVHAVGASCTHYGGPLAEGRVVDGTLRCPWHHACFDLRTGEALHAPALADIPCWQVVREGDLVRVRDKKERAKATPGSSPSSVVIVGAGAAGAGCAEALRKGGYAGPITMLGAEDPGPVDRPNLSKDYLAGTAPEEWIPLGSADHWKELKVELSPMDPATAIDTAKKTVSTKSGKTLGYGALLYATGAEPSRLPIDGANLPHVFTLRALADSRAIIERAKTAKRAVIIGASFIGLEVAASLVARGVEVHVVGRETVPLEHVLGAEVGAFVRRVHEGKGARFHLGTSPKAIWEAAVELATGASLPCDLVVLGVGVKPRTALAEKAGLEVAGGVVVDASLKTSAADVWAAGDVARYDRTKRIEHWVTSERAGQHAAREMLRAPGSSPVPFRSVPFFWSVHHDVSISYIGHISGAAEATEIHGSLDGRDAAILYRLKDERAVATINRDAMGLAVEEAMGRGDLAAIERIVRGG
jgi:NADPH-dependent 2,4-dienoyl-CoA reductase/sulfur reductase-like enzyme/nitrite reductase/ring-hydroxylating ferredoxin subunit